VREIRGSEMNNRKILYVWDRGIGKAFLRGNRLLGFWASEQLGCDKVRLFDFSGNIYWVNFAYCNVV